MPQHVSTVEDMPQCVLHSATSAVSVVLAAPLPLSFLRCLLLPVHGTTISYPSPPLPCSLPCIWRAAPGRDPALSEALGTAWVRRWSPRLPRPCLPGISQPAQCASKNSALPLAGLAAHMTYVLQLNAVCINIKALSSVLELADRA